MALQQIKERGALPMIDRGDIRQQSTVAAISGFTAGRWLCIARALGFRQPDCKNSKKGGTVREIDV